MQDLLVRDEEGGRVPRQLVAAGCGRLAQQIDPLAGYRLGAPWSLRPGLFQTFVS